MSGPSENEFEDLQEAEVDVLFKDITTESKRESVVDQERAEALAFLRQLLDLAKKKEEIDIEVVKLNVQTRDNNQRAESERALWYVNKELNKLSSGGANKNNINYLKSELGRLESMVQADKATPWEKQQVGLIRRGLMALEWEQERRTSAIRDGRLAT